jgi:2-polyprenyl-3-methyl-5-hydroxy-6-metoxy-1,4-benzoquinol methylase
MRKNLALKKDATSNKLCGICGSEWVEHQFWTYDRNWRTTNEQFAIVKCRSCKVCQTYPQPLPDHLNKYYPELYYPIGESSKRYYNKFIRRFQLEKIKKIKRFCPSGRILDIGCGVGFFIKEAIEADYEAEGIEFSELAAKIGRERWNLKIISGDFLSYPFKENMFDVVTLWHVFEHLYQPIDVLKKVYKILCPGGLLVIAAPNISSIQAHLFKGKWYHLEVPRHLFHYSPQSLLSLVEKYGFKVLAIDYYSSEHNGAGILGSIMQLSPPNESFIHKAFRKLVGIKIANALAWIESGFHRGGTFNLFAIKSLN